MAIISSVPNNNKLYGVISSITTDNLMGEVSYSPINWGGAGQYFEAVVPADAVTLGNFASGQTVTVLIKATAVSITNYDL